MPPGAWPRPVLPERFSRPATLHGPESYSGAGVTPQRCVGNNGSSRISAPIRHLLSSSTTWTRDQLWKGPEYAGRGSDGGLIYPVPVSHRSGSGTPHHITSSHQKGPTVTYSARCAKKYTAMSSNIEIPIVTVTAHNSHEDSRLCITHSENPSRTKRREGSRVALCR